jgi:hypothetical protein
VVRCGSLLEDRFAALVGSAGVSYADYGALRRLLARLDVGATRTGERRRGGRHKGGQPAFEAGVVTCDPVVSSTQVPAPPVPEIVTGCPAGIVPAEVTDVGAGAALVTVATTEARGPEPAAFTAATQNVKVPLGISTNVALRSVDAADIPLPD